MAMEIHDLGEGHSFSWLWCRPSGAGSDWDVADDGVFPDDVVGIIERHTPPPGAVNPHTPDGSWPGGYCEGFVTFRNDRMHDGALWKVESWEPLTITPSVHCTTCGAHGFITDGRWKPA